MIYFSSFILLYWYAGSMKSLKQQCLRILGNQYTFYYNKSKNNNIRPVHVLQRCQGLLKSRFAFIFRSYKSILSTLLMFTNISCSHFFHVSDHASSTPREACKALKITDVLFQLFVRIGKWRTKVSLTSFDDFIIEKQFLMSFRGIIAMFWNEFNKKLLLKSTIKSSLADEEARLI